MIVFVDDVLINDIARMPSPILAVDDRAQLRLCLNPDTDQVSEMVGRTKNRQRI